MFAYEQCLLVLGHHPDVWYEAAQYLEQSSKLLAEKGVRGGERGPLGALCVQTSRLNTTFPTGHE